MRRTSTMIAVGTAATLAVAGAAGAAVLKGAGSASISIIATSGGHGNNTSDVKPAGSISAKPAPSKAGVAPTGGAGFAAKLAKNVGDPTKPGYADGDYVLEVESSPTPDGNVQAYAYDALRGLGARGIDGADAALASYSGPKPARRLGPPEF